MKDYGAAKGPINIIIPRMDVYINFVDVYALVYSLMKQVKNKK